MKKPINPTNFVFFLCPPLFLWNFLKLVPGLPFYSLFWNFHPPPPLLSKKTRRTVKNNVYSCIHLNYLWNNIFLFLVFFWNIFKASTLTLYLFWFSSNFCSQFCFNFLLKYFFNWGSCFWLTLFWVFSLALLSVIIALLIGRQCLT